MRIIFLVIISCLVYSCNQYDQPTIVNLRGTMTGFVRLVDENGDDLSSGGVKVSVDGTNFSTLSDSSGKWTLSDVTAGTYDISFSKEGFGTNKVVSFSFVGNGTAYLNRITVPAVPSFTSTLDIAQADTSDSSTVISVVGNLSDFAPLGSSRLVLLFLAKTPSVSSDPSNYTDYVTTYVPSGTKQFSHIFSKSQLNSMGLPSGCRVYITSFSTSKLFYHYTDVISGKYFFTGLSDKRMNYLSFIVP